ncbi:hypothetical protein DL96DRAFT_1704543 [Flagelloscypha sp. PMI_526]|nr:hypothetical protein DL96DRAFT_1704543 [Flagelloscypha sp. PMI_526]
MSESSTPILDLPSNVITRVFYYSTAFSRISLRQTCTKLCSHSKERNLWINCLKRLIQTSLLYPPSFPIDEMNNEHLEAAANAPLRFRCNLANGRTSFAPTRWLQEDQNIKYTSRHFALVPGGRFLVTLTGELVRMWDIGMVGCEHPPHHIIAEVNCGVGSNIRPRVATEFNDDEFIWCAVYRINPLENSPQFTLLGLLDTKLFTPNAFHFDPYKMVIIYSTPAWRGGNIWIWDISTNSLATWPGDDSQDVIRIYIMEGHVLLLKKPEWGKLLVRGDIFTLPKFSSPFSPQKYQKLPSPFIHSISWEEDFPGWSAENGSIICPAWLEARENHFPFDLVGRRTTGDEGSVSCEIVHKVLQISPSDPSRLNAVTCHQGLYRGNMVLPPDADMAVGVLPDISFTVTYLPDDVRIMYWILSPRDLQEGSSVSRRLYVHVNSLAEKGECELSRVDMCMPLWTHWSNGTDWTHQHMTWEFFEFSPATGRFCIADGDDIRIVDYGSVILDVAMDRS